MRMVAIWLNISCQCCGVMRTKGLFLLFLTDANTTMARLNRVNDSTRLSLGRESILDDDVCFDGRRKHERLKDEDEGFRSLSYSNDNELFSQPCLGGWVVDERRRRGPATAGERRGRKKREKSHGIFHFYINVPAFALDERSK